MRDERFANLTVGSDVLIFEVFPDRLTWAKVIDIHEDAIDQGPGKPRYDVAVTNLRDSVFGTSKRFSLKRSGFRTCHDEECLVLPDEAQKVIESTGKEQRQHLYELGCKFFGHLI